MITKVLDKGAVEYIGHYGSDNHIVEVARTSTSGSKKRNDVGLLRYLMRHEHESPFEFCEMTFKIKCPIFVARQIMRHRTSNFSEQSGRYSNDFEDRYVPEVIRMNPQKNKHIVAEDEQVFTAQGLQLAIEGILIDNNEDYIDLIQNDLANEVARIILPLATYTTFYFKTDLRNLFHFLKLRTDKHAQYETRQYAKAIAEYVQEYFPISYQAFLDYKVNAKTFTSSELKILAYRLFLLDFDYDKLHEDTEYFNDIGMSKGEVIEFFEKLKDIDKFYNENK